MDLYPDRAASIVASLNISRCILSAIIVAITQFIINGIGTGWTFTIYTLVGVFIPIPVTIVLIHYGPRWQTNREQGVPNKKMSLAPKSEYRDAEREYVCGLPNNIFKRRGFW